MIDILKTKKVLYAEDNQEQQKLTEETLKFFFKEVYIASNGQEALEICNEEKIDIAILDIEMPFINGIDLAKQIKDKNIMIIFLSAYTDQKYFLDAIKIKVEDYLIKPFSLDEFIEVFKRVYKDTNKKEIVHKLKNGKLFYEHTNVIKDKDKKIKLGSKESHLLSLLIKYSPDVLTKQVIDEEIWAHEMTESTYRSLLKNLRAKVGKELISTVSGIGILLK